MNYQEKRVKIDADLSQRVLDRLGLESGEVEVRSEEWDLGFCDTCSHLERGFSVYVDGQQVWPSKDYLRNFGGYIYADGEGVVEGETLSVFGYFFEWLEGADMEALAHAEDEGYEDDDDEE